MAPHFSTGGRARLRKVKKPEAERRRRARMALAVERLRLLLMEGGAAPLPPVPCTPPHLHHLALTPRRGAWQRLEKVVVLELTVAHLRRLAAHHPGDGGRQQFREGYRRCQEEVMRFLGRTAALQSHMAARLRHHMIPFTTASRGSHPSPDLVKVTKVTTGLNTPTPVPDSPHTAPEDANPPLPTVNKSLQSHSDSVEMTPLQCPFSNLAPPPRAPYANMHWKKCLRTSSRTYFWRPW
ncbi:transcription factor HES-2-like isoform X2 [Portunus trituberculatus]|uniref:transcription factor HES-2-like isoform X2 n=1 Tax=Portunus trituberculatus TaxID=210409 RepID=UPI001E1D0C71|nr:transcription factor HES-2-like isoform X2 [Portunus trituberculatus]